MEIKINIDEQYITTCFTSELVEIDQLAWQPLPEPYKGENYD